MNGTPFWKLPLPLIPKVPRPVTKRRTASGVRPALSVTVTEKVKVVAVVPDGGATPALLTVTMRV